MHVLLPVADETNRGYTRSTHGKKPPWDLRRRARFWAVDVDSRLLDLIAFALLAALGCGVAWTLDRNIFAAVFAAESAAAILAAILRSR
jgi:hypothetical protein